MSKAENLYLTTAGRQKEGRKSKDGNALSTENRTLITAARKIVSGDVASGRALLKSYAATDIENPETYNLLGISYETEGDRVKAARFYRVAYYMDQAFAAAAENLDRVCGIWYKGCSGISWGLNLKEIKL